ncbi:hypothetical protein FQA39_LY07973 [Lamprigera yunnana]|nr:hypothetical protein FQA39_LY07973 [Lamprigera yunnana]
MFQHSNKVSLLKRMTEKYSVVKKELVKSHRALSGLRKENAELRALLKSAASQKFMDNTPVGGVRQPVFNSPAASIFPSNYSNTQQQRINTSFAYTPLRYTQTPWNRQSAGPQMMLSKEHPSVENSYLSSLQTSIGDSSLDGSVEISNPSFANRRRPTAMMPMSHLNLGLGNNNKPR